MQKPKQLICRTVRSILKNYIDKAVDKLDKIRKKLETWRKLLKEKILEKIAISIEYNLLKNAAKTLSYPITTIVKTYFHPLVQKQHDPRYYR